MSNVASATESVASLAARTPHGAPALGSVTSVTRQPSSAARVGDASSVLPSLLRSSVDWNENDGVLTPVTCSQRDELNRKANTHDFVSVPILETESAPAKEIGSMSLNELEALACRHVAYAAQLRAGLKRQFDVDQGFGIEGNLSGSKETPVAAAENWGDVSVLQNFSDANSAGHGKSTGHTNSFPDFSLLEIPSPKTQSSREDSKSPKAMKAETPAELPKAANKADKPIAVAPPIVAPQVAPRPQPTKQAHSSEFANVGPVKNKVNIPVLNRAANNASAVKSGLTAEEIVALVMEKINELQLGQSAGKELLKARAHSPHKEEESPVPKAAREAHIPRGTMPGRFAAANFFETLRAVPKSSAKSNSSPEDPSDSSSMDTDSSSSSRSSGTGRRSSSPQLLSKRRRTRKHNGKILLKPIPPLRYNGEPNANAIQRFAHESKTYIMMGRVPEAQQVYFVSYYLDGKALDFIIKLL
ncbi:hypothetical protein K438DRAFT_1974333 [Mycena galopus ATCC 62051]|nr:hypothetical protein K438DRAFT_1974333 [Mycena galopus ATCC 62051]